MKAEDVLKGALKRHEEAVLKMDTILEHAARGADMLAKVLIGGNKVLACGNGGSAADAEHFVGELLCRYKEDRKALPGISLLFPVGALTAIANDYSFDDVFARQVDALGQKGDILVALSTSGKSRNVLAALSAARRNGLVTIFLTGVKGSTLTDVADLVVAVPSEETARIQEMHELIYHGWCEYLDTLSGIQK